jgi:hypothetical protein
MVARIAKLCGNILPNSDDSDVTVNVLFDKTMVYSGPVTLGDDVPVYSSNILATWEFDSSIHGIVPITIEVNGGSLTFVTILMNYSALIKRKFILNTEAEWPAAVPTSGDDLRNDVLLFTEEEFLQKYAINKTDLVPNYATVAVVGTADAFHDPNDNVEDDGKRNVRINNIVQQHMFIDESQRTGEWHWVIPDQGILECDFLINPPYLD